MTDITGSELEAIIHKYCGASKNQYLNGDFVLPEVIEAEAKKELETLLTNQRNKILDMVMETLGEELPLPMDDRDWDEVQVTNKFVRKLKAAFTKLRSEQ